MRFTTPLALAAVLALAGCPAPTEDGPPTDSPPPTQATGGQATSGAPTPAAGKLGSFVEGGVRFEIKAVVPVWNAEEGRLTLFALPFEPDAEQIEACRKDNVFFMLMERENDLPGFSDRTPYAHVAISWPFDEADVGKAEKASLHVFLNNLKEKGSNMNVSRGGGEGIELSGELAAGNSVKVHAQGKTDVAGTQVEWDLKFSGELLASLEK